MFGVDITPSFVHSGLRVCRRRVLAQASFWLKQRLIELEAAWCSRSTIILSPSAENEGLGGFPVDPTVRSGWHAVSRHGTGC